VLAPRVEAEQNGSISVQDLTKVVMGWRRLRLAETSLTPMIVHVRFMAIVCHGFTRIRIQSV